MNSLCGFLHKGQVGQTGMRFKELRYWKKSLTFCLECLKYGHHSTLHQFGLFNFAHIINLPYSIVVHRVIINTHTT